MQVLKYKWADFDTIPNPQITMSSEMGITKMQLISRNISLKIGKKRCIGSFVNGNHKPCPNEVAVEERGEFCNACAAADDYCMCIRCTGEKCINEKQRNSCEKSSYFIYLAAFDNMLKVGISLDRRIMERLIEQGADLGAKIARVQDGMVVRQIEQQIKNRLGIVDRIRGHDKQRLIFGSPNIAASNIRNAVLKLRASMFLGPSGAMQPFSKYMLNQPEIYDFRKYYNLERVPYTPRPIQLAEGSLEGTCVAAKGNVLIFSSTVPNAESLYAVAGHSDYFSINAHELVGREIELLNN
ncbi:MAG: DUF2797 domain-containing protein [Candidatus Aenigmarchaeota archaeon]|nr:DUF2797 domain-containing protein [Candidatus Aenigmarchaeota archaeon]